MSAILHIHTSDTLIEDLAKFSTDSSLHADADLRTLLPEFPIHFYDRHVDPHLALAQVKIVPTMLQLLSDFCDGELQLFKSNVKAVPTDEAITEQRTELTCARDYADLYRDRFAQYCLCFPSALYLHPGSMSWEAVTTFSPRRSSRNRLTTFVAEGHIQIGLKYRLTYDPGKAAAGMYLPDEAGVRKLNEMHAHSPSLALWHCYPLNMSGEKIITQMSDTSSFNWETSATLTPHPVDSGLRQMDPDTEKGFVKRIHEAARPKAHRKAAGQRSVKRKKPLIAVPSVARRGFNSDKPYRVDWRHFLQHAWAQAVAEDVTFIVLTCGKLERIGIRHRASQTLYLSHVINTVTAKAPTYGKIHLALHFAIMQDALGRHEARKCRSDSLMCHVAKPLNKPGIVKRPGDETDGDLPPAKRRREVPRHDGVRDLDAIFKELSDRNLFLVSLNYGTYQSPTPSSFIRKAPSCAPAFYSSFQEYAEPPRRKSYKDDEYVTLSLGRPIGDGATGTIHRASAEIRLQSGEIIRHDLVAKLVFLDRVERHPEERTYSERLEEKRLWDEYAIYQHLASVGCTDGILPVFGLFEDADTGTLALVMGDGGSSLESLRWEVEPEEYIKTALEEHEQQRILNIMQKIHEAGVRHRDIWATNILKGKNQDFYIIDFDMAELLAYPSEAMTREKLKLENIVKGIDDSEDELLYSS